MLHIVVGIIAIVIGLWGIMSNWYMFKDMLVAVVPLVVLLFGIVAILAGIRKMKATWAAKESREEA
jgi:di/tricarboxylate transporter